MSNFNLKKIWFDFWNKADDVKSNVLNSIFARVDAVMYKTIERNESSPPADPVEGEVLRIIPTGAGQFVQKEDWLAYYYNGSWRLIEPLEGFYFYDKAVGSFIYYDGTQWTKDAPTGQCYADHNTLHNYDEHEHEDWGEPGAYKIDVERMPREVQDLIDSSSCSNPQISHYDLLDVAKTGDDEHIDWSEPGAEKIDVERIPRDEGLVATGEPTGMPNRDDSSFSWDDSTRTLTVTGRFDVWWKGKRYANARDRVDTVQIPDTSGFYFIHYDEGVTLTSEIIDTEAKLSNAIRNYALFAGVYWDANTNEAIVIGDERHGIVMDNETHHYLHETRGAQLFPLTGFEISGYTLEDDSDSGISFDLTNGEFYDEDLGIDVEDGDVNNQYEQVLTGDAEIPVMYRDDIDGTWTQDPPSSLPYKTAGSGRLAYNNDDGDGTWSQIECGNNKFVAYTLIATNDSRYPIKMVQGVQEYDTKSEAETGGRQEVIDLGDFPAEETCILYRFIMQTATPYGGTKNARIDQLFDYRGLNLRSFRFAFPPGG